VEKKLGAAQSALFLIKRLGNTQRGLSLQALRQLYQSCVNSIADYGVPIWWKRKSKGFLVDKFQKLQNTALRLILGAFKGSPTMAMEIEGGIPPPDIRFEKLCKMYSLRVLKLQRNNPIKKAYFDNDDNIKEGEGRDELGVESDLESANSTIRHILP